MGVEALIRKILEFLGEQGIIISADQSNWYVFWFGCGGGEIQSCNLQVWEN